MIKSNLDACEYIKTMDHYPSAKEFDLIAERFKCTSGKALHRAWHRYKKACDNLTLKKEVLNKDGEVISQTFGRDTHSPDINLDDFKIIGGTTDSNGGPGWWRYISKDQERDLERMQKEVEEAHRQKEIIITPAGTDFETWVIIGCVHVPYEDRKLWAGLISYLSSTKIDGLIIAGDFLDLKSISNYDADKPFELTLYDEYMEGYKRILELNKAVPNAKKIFIYGNHEDRYIREISKISGAKYGPALISPESGMKLKELGFEVLTNWREDYAVIGNDLEVIHGYRLGVSSLKKSLEDSAKNNRSVVYFHTHNFGSTTNGRYQAYNGGGLFDRFNIDAFGYVGRSTRDSWQTGFVKVVIDTNGDTYPTPVKCNNGRFFLDGMMWGG